MKDTTQNKEEFLLSSIRIIDKYYATLRGQTFLYRFHSADLLHDSSDVAQILEVVNYKKGLFMMKGPNSPTLEILGLARAEKETFLLGLQWNFAAHEQFRLGSVCDSFKHVYYEIKLSSCPTLMLI